MWTFLLLYSVYFTVLSAQKLCPAVCQCDGTNIKCSRRHLLQIPKWLPKDVTNLDLSGNKLTSFKNGTFQKFPNLIELNLNDNDISNVADLGKFPKSLNVLHLKRNKLKSLYGNWSQFTKLDFSQNQIQSIGNETFSDITSLTELYLSNNEIAVISPTAFKDLQSLQTLQLDGNNLTELPHIKCPSLKILDLSNNKLKTLNSFQSNRALFQMVPAVKILKLSNNRIRSFKIAQFSVLKLKHLYLNGNLLENVVEDWMFGMISLEYLYLQNNKIVNISTKSWKANCCHKLKHVNLAHNKLKRVSFNDHALNKLHTLNLSSNEIFDIFDRGFESLQQLKILDLSGNRLSIVEKSTFEKLQTLEKLDLKNNPIIEITKNAFTSLQKLKDLQLNSKVLYCSCKLRWFSKWLKTKSFSRSIGFTCNQPKKLFGLDLTKIPAKDLVCDSSRPEIFKHPESQIAMRGDDVRLSCTVKNGSLQGIEIRWQKNMKNIDMSKSKVTIYTQVEDKFVFYKSILYLNDVNDAKDSGAYQCLVIAGKEQIPSRTARLRVYVPPKFTSTPGDLVTNLGDDIHFNCSASGHPEPEIYFRKVKVPHFRRQYDLNGFIFIIRNVSHSDVGLYRCFARSEAGVINTTFTLNVIGKPVATHKMLDKVILINDAAVFVCAANGWPRPKYTWYKDGKILDFTSSNLHLRMEQNAQHLIILNAEYADAGNYKCLVSNDIGSVEMSSQLKVVKDFSKKSNLPDDENITHKTLVSAVIFTAACTMVLATLISMAILHVITRRGCFCFMRHKTSGTVILDSYAATDPDNRDYVQMTENEPDESPRSSSTYVTSSDSRAPSDLQTSCSESGSSKEHRDGSYDGRHSSGVCSMNSSSSSLASTSNHRNTFPFSNTKTYLYQGTEDELHDSNSAGGDPESLQIKLNEQYYPGRRKHRLSRDKPSRSRERHVNKRRREQERLHTNETFEQATTDEYRTESVTESEGTVL